MTTHESGRTGSYPESLVPQSDPVGVTDERVDIREFAGGLPQHKARLPQIRIGTRWYNPWLALIVVSAVGALVFIAICQQLRQYDWMQSFMDTYPGTSDSYAQTVDSGFPAWLRWQHLLNAIFMLFIIRAGIQILADHPRLYLNSGSTPGTDWLRIRGPIPADRLDQSRPDKVWTAKDDAVALPKWLGIPGIRHSIGLARWVHFSFDLLWLINGTVFVVLLFVTDQWHRLIPTSWTVFPNALSAAIQYGSLDFPANEGYTNFNGLQIIAYFLTIFVVAPLAPITGLLQAPAVAAKLGTGRGPLNRQVARTLHFFVLAWMVFFILVHTVMVFVTGLVGNLNHIVLGANTQSLWPLLVYVLVMIAVVAVWLAASPFTLRYPRLVQKTGRFLVGWIKGLMEWSNPRADYSEKDISPYFWPNGTIPVSDRYREMRSNNWSDYTLLVNGLVENPTTFTYRQLLDMPKHEQITQHFCIQGWSAVGKWGGVRMADILKIVQPTPEAKYAVFYSMAYGGDGPAAGRYYDCHKIEHMSRDLTILAYEMNGEPLTETHGAPLRLRNEDELGFKQVKWIEAIEFVESFEHIGRGQGGYNEDHEFYGYRMPI
ncbi:molybdopterin-dependent oxidoreductase [Gordonia humi]|uniref:Thiosulfate reductase cytochrome b subunit n=1 Tax=Gordonia humi TaxID=686429 RepID=A0A840FDK4_9ACTN|nr:thiosulfate reductase cytochrome b subunit [Gordonia humi]